MAEVDSMSELYPPNPDDPGWRESSLAALTVKQIQTDRPNFFNLWPNYYHQPLTMPRSSMP